MDNNKPVKALKDGPEKEDSPRENDFDDCVLKSRKSVTMRVSPQNTIIFKVNLLQGSNSCMKGPFGPSTCILDNTIRKHILTLDEKYLRRCLELIHRSASNGAQCNVSLNLGYIGFGNSYDCLNANEIRDANTCDLDRFIFEHPSVESGDVAVRSVGYWSAAGSIMGSKSMMHILNTPLLGKTGAFGVDSNFGTSSKNDEGSICCNIPSNPDELCNDSPQNPEKGTRYLGNNRHGYGIDHKKVFSTSSTTSTCSSDQSNSSASASVSQGMIQYKWKGGIPTFVFSLDDQGEVYVANMCKIESAKDKGLDYMYLFNSKKFGRREQGIHDNELHLVGKMKVSTLFTLCPNRSKIMQREFVFSAVGGGNFVERTNISLHNPKKHNGLSKKVVEAFRNTHLSKQKHISKFDASTSILEHCAWEPHQDMRNNTDPVGCSNVLEDNLSSNLEVGAIVVKEHLPENREREVGGWGLQFLKKVDVTHTANAHAACFTGDSGGCSTSLDVLVPAGIHGGPRTRNGGPSSLIERWKSGGGCDCGGWDSGCPLTVLSTRSGKEEVSSPKLKIEGECKQVDLFVQGSKHGVATLSIVNVHEGLYFIQFESTLSALQSFAIAVAYIHSQSPNLCPNNIQ